MVDKNGFTYYLKKENFYVSTEYKKTKSNCPVTAKILEEELIVTGGAHNQSSAQSQTKIIKDFVINNSLGTDVKPQRVLADITTAIQNRSFGGATTSHLPKKETLMRTIRYKKQKAEVIN